MFGSLFGKSSTLDNAANAVLANEAHRSQLRALEARLGDPWRNQMISAPHIAEGKRVGQVRSRVQFAIERVANGFMLETAGTMNEVGERYIATNIDELRDLITTVLVTNKMED
jgi:hypothetical protein